MPEPDARANALREADHCVKCGLCLPHCPTYRLYRNENESPRGRIALTEGLLSGRLAADKALRSHIDHCLLCRNCEVHCPSGVRLTPIIDAARNLGGGGAGLAGLIDSPLFPPARRLAAALHLPGALGRLARALPRTKPTPRFGLHSPRTQPRGRISLLLGCVTREQQPGALDAAVTMLNALAYAVDIPRGQVCCGALAAHQGDAETASRQVRENREVFEKSDTVVSVASACALQLHEAMPERPSMDIVTFLARELPQSGLRFERPAGAIALHVPCSLHNGLRETDSLWRLLELLPGQRIELIGEPGDCCGAGGAHLLRQRPQAETLRAPLIDRLRELQPRYLLSTNVGCALHLAEGCLAEGLDTEVLHPVELLARHLKPEYFTSRTTPLL